MTGLTDRERYGPGDRIAGKYHLVRLLGEGGMGTVWVAHNEALDVRVAIKLLRAELIATHSERLLAEARTLARLQHPAIVRVHDCGHTAHGDPFIVMELLDGESLADVLERRGRLPAMEAVSQLLPVIDGLRVAHEAGIVHRDVKPENVFLANVGGRIQPKLLDFGIALAAFTGARRTTHGAVLGSPAYMSPEQARGDSEIDGASDVWALSVMLHELTTGHCPFERDNYNAVLRAIIEDEPPSILSFGGGDELLAAIVERGLEKDRARRFHSARELGVALAQWLWGHGITEDASHVSLRTVWLTRISDAPHSLSPVTVPEPARSAPTIERAALPSLHSTEGVAISPEGAPAARSRRVRAALGVGALAALAAAGLWLWPSANHPPGSASSASAARREPPPAQQEKRSAPAASARPPVAPAEDAGTAAPAETSVAPSPPAPTARPRSTKRPYRPRGI